MLRESVGRLVGLTPLILLAAACGSKGQTATGTGGGANTGGSGGATGSIATGSAGSASGGTSGRGQGGTPGDAGVSGNRSSGAGGAGEGGRGGTGGSSGGDSGGSSGAGGTGEGGRGGTTTGVGGGCPPPPATNGEECHAYDSRGYYSFNGFWIVAAECTPGIMCSFWTGGGLNVCAQSVSLQPTICCEGWGFVTGLTAAVCPTLLAGEDPRCPPAPTANCSPEGLACTWEAVADNGAGGASGAGMMNSFPRVCCQGRWWHPNASPCSADAGAD